MMRKVINDSDAVNFTADLTTAADTLERSERVGDGLALDSPGIGGNDRGQGIAHVEVPNQRHLKLAPFRCLAEDMKARHSFRVIYLTRLPSRLLTQAKRFNLREQFVPHRRDHLAHLRTVPAGNQPPGAGYQVHQAAKSQFHGVQIVIYIRVIKFDIVNDGQLWQVVHELWSLIEVSRVVFVALDNKVITVGDMKAGAEILHDSAHHE